MDLKIVKIQNNASRKLTSVDLLMATVYGNNAPTKFNPTRYYKSGEKVYIEESDSVIIKECTKDGYYASTTDGGWIAFAISQDPIERPVPYGQFIPGNYETGDRQTIYNEATNSVIIMECNASGHYTDTSNDYWEVVELIPGDAETNDRVIEEMFGDTIHEYIPGTTYPSAEKVYVINTDTNEVSLYQNVSIHETTVAPPNKPWVKLEADEHLPQNIGSDIIFATDIDIRNMFGSVLPDDNDRPDAPDGDEDIEWEEF